MATRQKWQRQEKDWAKTHSGTRNSGSGNGVWRKNDVRFEGWSIEAKYTDKTSYSLKQADLSKARENALLDGGRDFAFAISFSGDEYVVIERSTFDGLIS